MVDLRELKGYINREDASMSIGIAATCIKNNKVLLVKNTKFDFWSFPGGHVHEDESILDALKRELAEEASIVKYEVVDGPLFYQYKWDEKLTLLLFFYKIEIPENTEFKSVNGEVVDAKWFDVNDIPEHVYENTKVIIRAFSQS